jgi:hypothetical protein
MESTSQPRQYLHPKQEAEAFEQDRFARNYVRKAAVGLWREVRLNAHTRARLRANLPPRRSGYYRGL